MTSFVISTTTTTAQSLIGSETGIITDGGTIASVGSDAVTMSGTTSLVVLGDIVALGGNAIGTVSLSEPLSVQIQNAGTITANLDAVEIMAQSAISFVNSGTILSQGDAVDLRFMPNLLGSLMRVSNSGTIQGIDDGLVVGAKNISAKIVNSGVILGVLGRGIALDVDPEVDATGTITIQNSGTISGAGGSILGRYNPMIVLNSGLLQGNVELSSRDDLYRGGLGTLDGQLHAGDGADTAVGGEGDDTFIGGAGDDLLRGGKGDDSLNGADDNDVLVGGLGDDTLSGDVGDDDLSGGRGDDFLTGDDGNDTLGGGEGQDALVGGIGDDVLTGSYGDDTLLGEAGNDDLSGGDGRDFINGGAGNDLLNGQDGNDVLGGGGGLDTINGGAGDDRISGGGDFDQISGGAGADVFVYATASESTLIASDMITDFAQGLDIIDLKAVSPQVLAFQGSGPFAGGGVASVQALATSATLTQILVDTNGDGAADMRIRLVGNYTLTAGDFLL